MRGRGQFRRGMEPAANSLKADATEIDYPGDRLARQRLAPVEAYLARHHAGIRHLVVLPSVQMAAIPIETLTARYSISYAPSGTMFAWLQERTAAASQLPRSAAANLLALGDPAFAHVAARRATPPLPLPDRGVLVNRVVPGSNAKTAGIQVDDVLLNYAGIPLNKNQDMLDVIKKLSGNGSATIPVQVWRDGRQLEVQVRPGRLGVYFPNDPAPVAIAARRSAEDLLRRTLRSDRFDSLPGTRREVEAIAGLFTANGSKAEKLLGADANERQLDRLAHTNQLRSFRYVHLATHAKPDPRGGMQSFLALAPGLNASGSADELAFPYGRLTAEQILRDWKIAADLVTLSACETGLGKQSGGEGYIGFAQALFLAGARSLVLSLWQVDDTATSLLMTRFYQNLLGRRPEQDQPMPKGAGWPKPSAAPRPDCSRHHPAESRPVYF